MSNVLSGVKYNRPLENKAENEKAECFEVRVRSLAVIILLICSFWCFAFFSPVSMIQKKELRLGQLNKKHSF